MAVVIDGEAQPICGRVWPHDQMDAVQSRIQRIPPGGSLAYAGMEVLVRIWGKTLCAHIKGLGHCAGGRFLPHACGGWCQFSAAAVGAAGQAVQEAAAVSLLASL